jgi:hypothetical protein
MMRNGTSLTPSYLVRQMGKTFSTLEPDEKGRIPKWAVE